MTVIDILSRTRLPPQHKLYCAHCGGHMFERHVYKFWEGEKETCKICCSVMKVRIDDCPDKCKGNLDPNGCRWDNCRGGQLPVAAEVV